MKVKGRKCNVKMKADGVYCLCGAGLRATIGGEIGVVNDFDSWFFVCLKCNRESQRFLRSIRPDDVRQREVRWNV